MRSSTVDCARVPAESRYQCGPEFTQHMRGKSFWSIARIETFTCANSGVASSIASIVEVRPPKPTWATFLGSEDFECGADTQLGCSRRRGTRLVSQNESLRVQQPSRSNSVRRPISL